jgi:hypothetical protein
VNAGMRTSSHFFQTLVEKTIEKEKIRVKEDTLKVLPIVGFSAQQKFSFV